MTFGYWSKSAKGLLEYHDLSKPIKDKIADDEQFWEIISYNHWVVFQSLDKIYVYNSLTNQINIIQPKDRINRLFTTSSGLFYQNKTGVFEIENNKSKLVLSDPIINDDRIINSLEINQKNYLFSQQNGIYIFENNQIKPFQTQADDLIKNGEIYSAKLLKNQLIAIGTISQGLIILDKNGQIINQINQSNGLINNTVLSIFEDIDENIWLGLDNGINCINYQSPIRSFVDETGQIGTVYTSIFHQNNLYIGSNQGLFYKKYPSNDKFLLVNGTKGQVWSLFVHDNTLFCGHDKGTLIINNFSSKSLFNDNGTWKFEVLQDKIIQGQYNGLGLLEKVNNQWVYKKKIKGFNHSAKHFEINSNREIIVNHEYKGLFLLDLVDEQIKRYKLLEKPRKGKNSGLVKYNKKIYYASESGVFQYKNKEFVKETYLNQLFKSDVYTTGKMIVDQNNKLWFFTKNYIHYFTLGKLSDQYIKQSLSITSEVTNSMPGYENLSYIGNNEYLIGTTNGFYVINPKELKLGQNKLLISYIELITANQKEKTLPTADNIKLNSTDNHLRFNLSIPFYNKYLNAEYQYFLEGYSQKWSRWQTQPNIEFHNLPPGDYTFFAKGKISHQLIDKTVAYKFTIKQPFYFNTWAKALYLFLLLLMGYFTHKFYNHYHDKRHEKIIEENNLLLELKELENQRELMKYQNEQLTLDVDKKSKELAISNLNLIKKTELLNIIKEDLKNGEDINEKSKIKRIISSINKDVKEDDTWHIFKEAFDKADNDFLKKMKQLHSTLTPNDLRLCAYLRINLNSKEIAPLLNISVRSVEIKRYRLRKKMNLEHDQGLTEYILQV
jgi:DNA-binding CsgD family transcriptional regulator